MNIISQSEISIDKMMEILEKQHESFKIQTGLLIDVLYLHNNSNNELKNIKLKLNNIYILSCNIAKLLDEAKLLTNNCFSEKKEKSKLFYNLVLSEKNCKKKNNNILEKLIKINSKKKNEVFEKKNLEVKNIEKCIRNNQKEIISKKKFLKKNEIEKKINFDIKNEDIKNNKKNSFEEIFKDSFMNISKNNSLSNIKLEFEEKNSLDISLLWKESFLKENNNSLVYIKTENNNDNKKIIDNYLKNNNSCKKNINETVKKNYFDNNSNKDFFDDENSNKNFFDENSNKNFFNENRSKNYEKGIKTLKEPENGENKLYFTKNYLIKKDNYFITTPSLKSKKIRKRGKYNILPLQYKKEAIRIARISSIKSASEALKIPEKNIKRWIRNGPERKPGAGRKMMDPKMEENLKNWIKDKFLKSGGFPDAIDIKKKARV